MLTTDAGSREIVQAALLRVAPELVAEDLWDDADLQVDLELDSMDFLNFVTVLHETTRLDVPERDYPQLATIGRCIAYVDARR